MKSVLNQGAVDLEYFVIDGGSTDGSVEIIRRYADRLAFWRSHPDGGQMDAIQDGFDRSTGDIMGWLNSDDMLTPWALRTVEDIFTAFPQVEWLTARYPLLMDERDILIATRHTEGFNPKAFFRGRNTRLNPGFYSCYIQQESTFWRRSLWEKAGARLDRSVHVAGDFEIWSRYFQIAELFAVNIPLGIFRYQDQSFTAREMGTYLEECRLILRERGARMPTAAECRLRRILRLLPRRLFRFLPLAYAAPIIAHTGRGGHWVAQTEWFL